MQISKIAAGTVVIWAGIAFAGERLVVDPLKKPLSKPAQGLKKAEQITVTGPLRVVPMQGAMLIVNSTNFGQVVLFSPLDVDASIDKKLKDIVLSGTSVTVTGTLNTVCSDTQLKAETMGCRRFDLTKQIILEKP